MTKGDALLAAVRAAPHDDLPRLVYADFLEEAGDPAKVARAEFIRVQCELARVDERHDRWAGLKATETRLWKLFGSTFRNELEGKLRNEPYRRGFVAPHRRMIVLDHFLNWSEDQLNRAPLWEFHVNLRPPERIDELTRSPRLRRLGFIGLWTMTDQQAVALANTPHAVNLAEIHCRHGVMTGAGMRALARSDHLPHLTVLRVDTAWVSETFAVELLKSPLVKRLKLLDLSGCDTVEPEAIDLLRERFPAQLIL
jgi:uncharacterized protein (TIGR02996 family)